MSAHLTHLFSLLLLQDDGARLSKAVSQAEAQMKAAGEADLWHFWKGQALLATGYIEEAAALTRQIENRDQAEALESLVQRAIAVKTNDPTIRIDFLERRFAKSHAPLDLFELCEAYYEIKNWPAIAQHAIEILEGIGTAAALRLAVESAQRVGNYRLCLELLKGRENLFPNDRFPADLRRLRVLCLRNEGNLEQAIPEAEALARETGDSSDLLALVAVRLEGADPKGAVIEARELLKRSDVAPEHHLQLAHVLKVEDQLAAVAHLEKAIAAGDRSPEFLAGALNLIFSLNREEKFAELQPALLHSASVGGPIKLTSPEGMIEIMGASAERWRETETLYGEGRIPLHWAVELFGGTLGRAYEERFNPTANAVDWPTAPPLFIRHGGRVTPGPRVIKEIFIDISSLLIADQIKLLDLVEKAFSSIHLPPSVIPALYHEIVSTQSHQPSKLDEARIITSLIVAKKLRVAPATISGPEPEPGRPPADWLVLLRAAQESDGFVVDYLPLRFGFPSMVVTPTEAESRHVTDCASVLSSLKTAGKLTSLEHETALRKLGAFAMRISTQEPPLGSSLYLHGNIVEVLAGAGFLAEACEYFSVYVQPMEQQRLDAEIDNEARGSQLRGRLRGLLDRIQRGLSATWRLLPALTEEAGQHLGHESACVSELMVAEYAADTFVWIDDRFLNAFGFCGRNPIVTIYGVLGELRVRGLLNKNEVFEKLHQLRKANLRHIPVTSEEILHLLGAARFAESQIVETPELRVLRQYVAACLNERGRLQVPPPPEGVPNPHGEVALLLNVITAVRDSITALWSEVNSENHTEVVARADWLLRYLWYEVSSLPWLLKREERHDEFAPSLVGLGLAQLYTQGLGLWSKRSRLDKAGESPRKLYFHWLEARFANDPETVEATGKHLAGVFSNHRTMDNRSEREQNVFRALSGELYEDLPQLLRRSLRLSKETLARLGIKQYDSVDIEGWSFEAREFWRAAEMAMRGGTSNLTSRKKPQQFALRYAEEGGQPVLFLVSVGANVSYALSDEVFPVLDRSEQTRRAVLRSHREWFDCPESLFHQHADRIAAIRNTPERLRQLDQWRSGSAEVFYASLRQRQESGRSVDLSHFEPPSARGLLNHVRISVPFFEGGFSSLLEIVSESLLREVGFDESFRRLAVFPVLMPKAIRNAYDAFSAERQAAWQAEALENLTSPIARLHLFSFIARTNQTLACGIMEELGRPEGILGCEAFRALLSWTLVRLELRSECSSWPASALLCAAWVHAGRLYELLRAVSSQETIKEFFADVARPTFRDLFVSQPEMWMDVSHPRRLRPRGLILHGIAAGFDPTSLDDAHRARVGTFLRGLCFDAADPVPIAHPDLQAPSDWLRNGLGSFLHGDRGPLLDPWLGEDAEYLSTNLIVEIANASITALRKSLTEEPTHWQMLVNILGSVSPPQPLREPLLTLLLDVRIVELASLGADSRRVALYFLMHQAGNFPESLRHLREQLVKMTQRFAEVAKSGAASRQDATLLVECAHSLSVAHGTGVNAVREFASIMFELLAVWPALADEVWVLLRGLIGRLPGSLLASIWPLVFELRKRARK